MTPTDPTAKLGKYFIWLAWIIVLVILVFVFQSALEQQINPNSEPEYSLNAQGQAEVILQQNRQGHYVTSGTIHEIPVTFLLDTGATQVSIPAHIADQLNLQATGQGIANTANGQVRIYQTHLNQLSIGNIYLYDVDAHINPGMKSDKILLGMSALKRLEFSQTGKQLILRERN
ncbi:retropepsin-like aspartic protease family protein [Thalassotalea profundi]|uniref:retropepsin-like aspartic protease family protein n=1 Tax=Thalassotalea profundi TaxID=2036687 RepID=UPI0016744064|nr:TIGR02281 family clan AA aspartic protease [Thalassotalea profundi]